MIGSPWAVATLFTATHSRRLCGSQVIVGQLWLEHHGTLDIKNETTGDSCRLRLPQVRCMAPSPPSASTPPTPSVESVS